MKTLEELFTKLEKRLTKLELRMTKSFEKGRHSEGQTHETRFDELCLTMDELSKLMGKKDWFEKWEEKTFHQQ